MIQYSRPNIPILIVTRLSQSGSALSLKTSSNIPGRECTRTKKNIYHNNMPFPKKTVICTVSLCGFVNTEYCILFFEENCILKVKAVPREGVLHKYISAGLYFQHTTKSDDKQTEYFFSNCKHLILHLNNSQR